MSVYTAEGAIPQGYGRTQPYELQIQQSLERVNELVSFVENEHFALNTLLLFWRQESRAHLTVQTIGRLLGRPLSDELQAIRTLMENALPYDLFDFAATIAPDLFEAIQAIRPHSDALSNHRAVVEQMHYAAEVRQAVLQHILASINARYQTPRFRDLTEASQWTAAYSGNLELASRVIQGTRQLLKEEMAAAEAHLRQIGHEIVAIETNAEARFGIVKRLRWSGTLEEAETHIHNILAERAEQIEGVTFAALTESKSPGFLATLAQETGRKAPKLAMLLLGVASAGVGGRAIAKGEVPTINAAALSLPRLPQPVRGEANPQDTARFAGLSQQTAGVRSARFVSDAVQQLVTDTTARDQVRSQGTEAGSRVQQFFDRLPATQGRQTLVVNSQAELEKLVENLTQAGYNEQDVLSLLGLSSAQDFTHPLTLDVRHGQEKPILFPYTPAAHVTAPHRAITPEAPAAPLTQESVATAPQPAITANPASVSNATATFRSLQPAEGFIVYRVQPDESLATIASRYGTTIQQVITDNSLTGEMVVRGQNLLLRRPGTGNSALPTAAAPTGHKASAKAEAIAKKAVMTGTAVTEPSSVVARYGDTLFPTLDAMPADAKGYFVGTVQEVGDFFNVRPGDIMGILRLEQNNAGWRLQENRTSSVGASGVGQIVPRTWNGWANPQHENYSQNVLDIEEYGGLGFDWAQREAWRTWQETGDRSALASSNADPAIFENSVAAVARHLVHWGLTRDFAERDPEGFSDRLADSIAVYNSGRTLDVSGDWVQSSTNLKTTAQYVAEAMAISEQVSALVAQPTVAVASPEAVQSYAATFNQLFDQSFAVSLSEADVERFLASNAGLREDVQAGKIDPNAAAIQLMDQLEVHYMQQGRSAIESAGKRPWPYVHDHETLYAQKLAASILGRSLTLYEIDDLMNRTQSDRDAIRSQLMSRADARLYTQARHLFDQMLERSTRGLPISNHEVTQLVQPLLAGYSPLSIDEATLQQLSEQLHESIQSLSEYQQIHSAGRFEAAPLMPMPSIFKGFGVSVAYQAGGRHTGIDLANPRTSDGREPLIYAVDEATVVHVGPLYCDTADACRGGNAIVLDHGNHVYSIYSHNSSADVSVGQRVTAGQPIGRQGNEGYSFGSHLHFEIHTGAPFTGDWQSPFAGGSFVNPADWLP